MDRCVDTVGGICEEKQEACNLARADLGEGRLSWRICNHADRGHEAVLEQLRVLWVGECKGREENRECLDDARLLGDGWVEKQQHETRENCTRCCAARKEQLGEALDGNGLEVAVAALEQHGEILDEAPFCGTRGRIADHCGVEERLGCRDTQCGDILGENRAQERHECIADLCRSCGLENGKEPQCAHGNVAHLGLVAGKPGDHKVVVESAREHLGAHRMVLEHLGGERDVPDIDRCHRGGLGKHGLHGLNDARIGVGVDLAEGKDARGQDCGGSHLIGSDHGLALLENGHDLGLEIFAPNFLREIQMACNAHHLRNHKRTWVCGAHDAFNHGAELSQGRQVVDHLALGGHHHVHGNAPEQSILGAALHQGLAAEIDEFLADLCNAAENLADHGAAHAHPGLGVVFDIESRKQARRASGAALGVAEPDLECCHGRLDHMCVAVGKSRKHHAVALGDREVLDGHFLAKHKVGGPAHFGAGVAGALDDCWDCLFGHPDHREDRTAHFLGAVAAQHVQVRCDDLVVGVGEILEARNGLHCGNSCEVVLVLCACKGRICDLSKELVRDIDIL
eukprot:comp21427_c0_seq1/m.46385 comp21427_c0_seq1/g.46385  ORF comp21427_c0_seq1/g.46385 comp21427_c0_seq1/m.46385 type:complete len:569 (+) comp21427_c0_seq1:842-2548(+)